MAGITWLVKQTNGNCNIDEFVRPVCAAWECAELGEDVLSACPEH